jgi:3-keto-disaccharide hydrolase
MFQTLILALAVAPAADPPKKDGDWVPLFNGKNLDGWTPKITGYPLGENFGDTFRVEDGVLKVAYDKYGGKFDGRFGHLFYKDKFSHYVCRIEYRFVGDQCPGGPRWAVRNSGLMFHCQPPETMRKDQEFPVSIEAQFLGGNGKDPRATGSVCTPGTNIVMDGKLITRHCTTSSSKTFHGDQWVTIEVEVRGSGKVIHRVNGDKVMEYEQPQLDPKDKDGAALIKDKKLLIEEGYLSLQAESHPIEFRKVEIKVLPK